MIRADSSLSVPALAHGHPARVSHLVTARVFLTNSEIS